MRKMRGVVAGRTVTSDRHDGRFVRTVLRLGCLLLGIVAGGCRRKPTEFRLIDCYDCNGPIAAPGECDGVHACLRAKLPAEYDGRLFQPLSPMLDECLGATPAEVYAAGVCAPFRFGTHRRNGRPVEVYVVCTNGCPDNMTYGVRYRDIKDEECACLSGMPASAEQIADFGCYPYPDHLWYERRHAPTHLHMELGLQSIALSSSMGSRLHFFQLRIGDVVESVNGEPVKDAVTLDSVLRRMPELAPDVMTVRRGTREEQLGGGFLPSIVEIHYVSQELLREIERSLNDEHLLDIALELPPGWQQMPGSRTIIVGKRYRSWVEGTTEHDSQRLDAAAARIASIAKTSRHVVPESAPTFDCHEAGGMLKRVAFSEGGRSIELSYIDWVEASTRTAEKIAALRREAASP
jgi:hypothetical protein